MDGPTVLTRVEGTFWTVWNYISGAVTRFLRPEPAVNSPGNNVDQERPVGGAERDPSQRDEEEKKEEEKKMKEEEEHSDPATASLPHSPPVALPPRTDIAFPGPGWSRDVQCTAVSARWGGTHSTPEEEETQRAQWLTQAEGERTEQASVKLTAATQQTIQRENHENERKERERLLYETRTEEPEERQQHQQDAELWNYPDEESGDYHSGLGEEIEKTLLAADGPEDKADQNPQIAEEKEEEARVRFSGDEEPDLNKPNNVSGLEMEGNDIVRENNVPCVNEENLETTEEGGGETHLSDDQNENHFKSSEAVWEPNLTGIVSGEDGEEKADLVMTFSDCVTLFVESPEPNLSSLVSNNGNTVVRQEPLEVEVKQVKLEEKEHSSFLFEGSDEFYRKGSDLIDPVGNQEVVGTKEEITKEGACGRVTLYVETTPVKNQEDEQNDESQLQEEVNQTRKEEEEEGGGEISVILQTAQDKELISSMNTEAETEFNSPEHLLCIVDTANVQDRVVGGGGGVSTHRSEGIDSPGVALTLKTESNNEQEMSAELKDVSPGTLPGSGAGPHGLNCVPCEETRGLIPEVNNGHVAAVAENTEQRALMGRDSEERLVTSQLPDTSGGFKCVAGLGEVDHSQWDNQDTTLKSRERENTAASPDMVVGGSVDSESIVDSRAPWGIEEQMSARAEQATGQKGEAERMGDGLSDEERSRHEAHKTDGEDCKTEELLFKFTLDGETSESTGAASEEAVALEDGVPCSIWYDNVAAQDDAVLCEEILTLPDAVIQKTTEMCEGESTAATMTEENNGWTLSQSVDYVKSKSIDQPIKNEIKSFEDGETETEDIAADISDAVMRKYVSNTGSKEAIAESVQQRNAGQSNRATVNTVGLAPPTDMTYDLLMKADLPDELLESTSTVTEWQTKTSTQEIIEHVEDVSAIKAAEDESALAFGQATEIDKEIVAMGVKTIHPEDGDHTPPDATETENQAVSQTDTRTPCSSSPSEDYDDDDEAADKAYKTHEAPYHQPNLREEHIRDPDELKEISDQIEGEEDKELPLESYSGKSALVSPLGISNIFEAPECDNSEHTSGECMPECEVLTTKSEGIELSEMLRTVPPGVPDVSPPFAEEKHSTSPEQQPQHHHPYQSSGKLSDNEVVSSQAEQDELSCQSQMIPVPISNSVDEDCTKPGVEDASHLLPDLKLSEPSFPTETDSVVLRERKEFGENRQRQCLDSKHPLHKVLLMNQARSRRSELFASSVPGLSAEERARQRHSLPPGTSGDLFELDIKVLDLTVQKSRLLVKNPSARPPTDPRAILQMPSLEPSPSHPSPQRASPLAGRPIGGLGVGIKLPGFGAGFPALKKTSKVLKEGDESLPEQNSEPQQGMSPKPTVADRKPRWTPPKHPEFGNPLMSELKNKLKKTSKE